MSVMSRDAILWRGKLSAATPPLGLPPLPPTARNWLGSLSSEYAESLIARAHTADRNWRCSNIKPFRNVSLNWDVMCTVYDISILPGGHYLVLSCSGANNKFSLIVFALDHMNATPNRVAELRMPSRPLELQTSYATRKGRSGITISLVRRRILNQNGDAIE